jgi:hypothetical protein
MSFRVGQRVVCVDDSLPANPWHRANPLVKRRIYTIQAMMGCRCVCVDIDGSGRGWQHWRFRPLIERSTDISALTELLNPLNHTPLPEDEIERVLLETADEALR